MGSRNDVAVCGAGLYDWAVVDIEEEERKERKIRNQGGMDIFIPMTRWWLGADNRCGCLNR